MALDDLDLEFEDEEEARKKKGNETVQQDVDLQFHVSETNPRKAHRPGPSTAESPTTPGGTAIRTPAPASQPMGEVKKMDEARAAQNTSQVKRPQGPPAQVTAPRPAPIATTPRAVGSSALKVQPTVMSLPSDLDEHESAEVMELREKIRKVELDSEVKVQVAEFKAGFIGEMLGDMKLMEHQINQLLVRINAKHPDLKQEALMIKKILADYTTKKRK